MTALLRYLGRDTRGITVVEFGIISPVFFLMLIGMFDLAHTAYTKSVLNGAVQSAARTSSLEGGESDEADEFIAGIVAAVAPAATVETVRVNYLDFADIGRPEWLEDDNANGVCDEGEKYLDENNNESWDEDIGREGNGGASDVVLYQVELTYERPFAMPLIPGSETNTLTASALRKNQPFADQPGYNEDLTRTCD